MAPATAVILTLFFICCRPKSSCISASTTTATASTMLDQWYQKYPLYPEYCSTPSQLKQRAIPPLTKQDPTLSTSLLHVTAIIRHGARTPYDNHSCWKGWESQSWDCDLKTLTAPPSEQQILLLQQQQQQQEQQGGSITTSTSTNVNETAAMFLFEKHYNALDNPPQLANFLNGTCQKGQLLLRGYVQELENGNMLRKTYMRDRDVVVVGQQQQRRQDPSIHDDLVLFDLNEYTDTNETQKKPYEEPNLYYRSDDDQRTIMSGQVLLRGMFGDLIRQHSDQLGTQQDPIVKVHTADRERDVLSPNAEVCPKLNDLWNEAIRSREYVQTYVKSEESREMNHLMGILAGGGGGGKDNGGEKGDYFREQAQDCLMTTICNDKDLPSILDDYGRHGGGGDDDGSDDGGDGNGSKDNNYFDRLNKYSFQPYNYVLRYNNAAYSKLAFGPMWVEILANMLPFVPAFKWQMILPQMVKEVKKPSSNAPLLSLFSAHDTTILPILATLGENVWDGQTWAPYASLIVIEVHKVGDDGDDRAFRLIYNGQVLTDRVDGCLKGLELCDVMYLFNQLRDVAVKDRDCASKSSTLTEDAMDVGKVLLTKEGAAVLFILTILSGTMGGFLTFVFLTRRLPYRRKDGKGVFNKAPSSIPMEEVDDIEVTHPYGYGAPDTSRNDDSKELVLEENIIL